MIIAVVLAGGAGAVARVLVDQAIRARRPGHFPAGTLAVNLSGALLLGLLTGLSLHGQVSPQVLSVIGSGFCGGYTTFSTAILESLGLSERGLRGTAAVNLFASLGGTLAAAAVGLALGRAM